MALASPSALDDFLFDLRGYLVLKQAVEHAPGERDPPPLEWSILKYGL